MRKRILVCGEFSELSSGYGTVQRELIKRFYNSGKYEVAEFAAGVSPEDPAIRSVPWKVYPVLPRQNDQEAQRIFNSNPAGNSLGQYVFESVCLDFKPTHICVPPGNQVMTERGYVNIESVSLQDFVLTHKNRFRKVTKLMKSQHIGKIVKIYARGCKEPISLTPEHPVLIYPKKNRVKGKRSIDTMYNGDAPIFIEASKVRSGDLVVLPRPSTNENCDGIVVSNFLTNCIIDKDNFVYTTDKSKKIPNNIKLDSDFSRLLGYFVGDGTANRGGIRFFFGLNEKRFARDVRNIINSIFNLDVKFYKSNKSKMIVVDVNSATLSKLFIALCGKPKTKNIPVYLWQTSKTNIKHFLRGIIRADGSYAKNTVHFNTSLKNVAYGYRMLCNIIGIPTNISWGIQSNDFTGNKKFIYYRVDGYGKSASDLHKIAKKHKILPGEVYDYDGIKRCRVTRNLNNHMVASVRRVRQTQYNGTVYNLEVEEDNSYTLQFCVHNCVYSDPWFHLPWMLTSPFRKFWRMAYQSPVDGSPQNSEWLALYDKCDALFTYTNWGAKILKEAMPNREIIPAHLCSDPNVFKPMDKGAIRSKFNVLGDAIIIGMCARNQPRKDFDSLMSIFRKFLNEAPENIAKRSFLYLHTSFPDQSWHFEEMISDHNLSSKVIFTYKCNHCKQFYPAFFQDARSFCRKCGAPALSMTSTHNGITREQLAEIYNIWDICFHSAFLGGLEFGILESIFCGVPALYTDYSGMEDFKETAGAIPVSCSGFRREPESGRYWGIINQEEAVAKLIKYASMPAQLRQSIGMQMRHSAVNYYNWDKTAQIWMNYFDSSTPELPWNSPPRNHNPIQPPKELANANPTDIVNWCIINIAGEPELINSRIATQQIYNLTNGFISQGIQKLPFNINNVIEYWTNRVNFVRFWESQRVSR